MGKEGAVIRIFEPIGKLDARFWSSPSILQLSVLLVVELVNLKPSSLPPVWSAVETETETPSLT